MRETYLIKGIGSDPEVYRMGQPIDSERVVHDIYFSCGPGGQMPEFTATFSKPGIGEPEGDVTACYSSFEEMLQFLAAKGISTECSRPIVKVPPVLMPQIEPECQKRGWSAISIRRSSVSDWFALGDS